VVVELLIKRNYVLQELQLRSKEFKENKMQFATRLGISGAQYNRYERNAQPLIKTAIKIAEKLDRAAEDIWYLTPTIEKFRNNEIDKVLCCNVENNLE